MLKHAKEIEDMKDIDIKNFVNILKEEFNKGSVTCALICRDKEHAKNTYEKLIKYEKYLEKDIVAFSEENYKTGLLILPITDAKGLEFDTVVILDINDKKYPDTELSTRLLYVAITRALHRLIVIENSNRSPLLI